MINNFNYAFRYFNFIENSGSQTWLDSYQIILDSEDVGLPEVLTLLEPKWYASLKINKKLNDPRGPEKFKSASVNASCQSMKFWHYSCPFNNSKVHVDHIFPFSRGGATHYENATYLCDKHNLMKFTDIHIMPWENLRANSDWIILSINNMIQYSSELAGKKIYSLKYKVKKL